MKKLQGKEWQAVFLSVVYFFCILASYYVMRPMREQLSAAVGSSHLPMFFAATFMATLLLTPLFSWIVSRWPRRIVMPAVHVFFIVCQLAFVPFFIHQNQVSTSLLGMFFFVWVSVYNLCVVSVFWSFMTDIWSDLQARNFFPIIALGGTAGAIAGPLLTGSLVEVIGIASLLFVSASLLALAIICVILLESWAQKHGVHCHEANSDNAIGGSMFDGLKQVFSNTFVGYLAVIMLLGDAIGTIGYALVTDYSGAAYPDNAIARTQFAATMDLAANVLQVILQVTVTKFLLLRYGAGIVIAIAAAINVIGCLLMAFVDNPYVPVIGSLPWVAILLISIRALAHGMVQPARETLFTLVPRELRYKGKNAVDTVIWRAGDIASALSVNGLKFLGLGVAGFGFISALLIAISGILGFRLANRTEQGEFEK